LKAAAPKEISISHIYRGVIPFIAIQALVLVLLITLPQIILWLPNLMDRLQGF